MPLKPEHKNLVVKALRSGEWKQARSQLVDPGTGGHCCIGVACAIIVGRPLTEQFPGVLEDDYTDEAAAAIGLLPLERERWVDWNDKKNLSFQEIADLIERN